MCPSAPKIFCLHKSDLPSFQCLERQVGSGDFNCQSLGVLPGSAVEVRNAFGTETSYAFNTQFLFRQIAVFSNLWRERRFGQLRCNTAKNFVLSKIYLILLFLSSGRVLEKCFKTKSTVSRVSQLCLRVDCSFCF